MVTHENKATVVLHADEAGAAAVQRFKISISKTYDRPRMLDYDGHAVTDGRPSYAKNAPVVPARAPVGPGRPGLPMGAGAGENVKNEIVMLKYMYYCSNMFELALTI